MSTLETGATELRRRADAEMAGVNAHRRNIFRAIAIEVFEETNVDWRKALKIWSRRPCYLAT